MARGPPCCCTDGESGAGDDTVRGLSCPTRPAASSAAFAFLFSASIWLIAELAFFGAGSLDGAVIETVSRGLALSNCFLAKPSRSSMIAEPRVVQTEWKPQKAARARSRTAGLTSPSAFRIADSSESIKPGVVSIAWRDRTPWYSR